MHRGAVRLAIWGLGPHATRSILPAVRNSTAVDLVAVHTRNPDILQEIATREAVVAHTTHMALLEDPNVDAIYLATPTGLHAEQGAAVVAAGKHLWCEKPITTGHAETTVLIQQAEHEAVVALEADMFLHHPQFLRLKQLLSSGEFGAIQTVSARFGFPHRAGADFRYSSELGGGALLDAGFYPLAAALGLLGPRLELLGAELAFKSEYTVDVGGTALASGAGGVAVLDWGFGRSYRSEIDVWCEGAVIELSRAFAKPATLETEIIVTPQDGPVARIPIEPASHFVAMLDEFAAVTIGDKTYDPEPMLERARLISRIRSMSAE